MTQLFQFSQLWKPGMPSTHVMGAMGITSKQFHALKNQYLRANKPLPLSAYRRMRAQGLTYSQLRQAGATPEQLKLILNES